MLKSSPLHYKLTISIQEICIYIFVAFSIYFSGTASASVTGLSSISVQRLLYFVYILTGFILSYHSVLTVNNWHYALGRCAAFAFLLFLINLVTNPSSSFHFIIRIIWLIIIFSICFYDELLARSIIRAYTNLIAFLAFISLITFILIMVGHPSYRVISSESGYYYQKYFGFYYILPGELLNLPVLTGNRMQAIFWEPGVFAVHLSLTLFVELFLKDRHKVFRVVILLICLYLTYSTTGIIVGVGILGMYLLTSDNVSKILRFLIFIPVIIIAIYIIVSVWSKKSAITLVGSSYGNRMADLIVGFKFFLKNILLGAGYNNDDAYASYFQSLYGFSRGNSNGLLTWMFSTGIIGTVILFYPFIRSLGQQRLTLKNTILVFVFLLLNMTEPLVSSPVMMFVISCEYYYVVKGYEYQDLKSAYDNDDFALVSNVEKS